MTSLENNDPKNLGTKNKTTAVLANCLVIASLLFVVAQSEVRAADGIKRSALVKASSEILATKRCLNGDPKNCPKAETILKKMQIQNAKQITFQRLRERCLKIFGKDVETGEPMGGFTWSGSQKLLGGWDLYFNAKGECGGTYDDLDDWISQVLDALSEKDSQTYQAVLQKLTVPFGAKAVPQLLKEYPKFNHNQRFSLDKILIEISKSSIKTLALFADQLVSKDKTRYHLGASLLFQNKTTPIVAKSLIAEVYPDVLEERKRELNTTLRGYYPLPFDGGNFSQPARQWLNIQLAASLATVLDREWGGEAAWALAEAGYAGRDKLKEILEKDIEAKTSEEKKNAATGVAYYLRRLKRLKSSGNELKFKHELGAIPNTLIELAKKHANDFNLKQLEELSKLKEESK